MYAVKKKIIIFTRSQKKNYPHCIMHFVPHYYYGRWRYGVTRQFRWSWPRSKCVTVRTTTTRRTTPTAVGFMARTECLDSNLAASEVLSGDGMVRVYEAVRCYGMVPYVPCWWWQHNQATTSVLIDRWRRT